MNEPLSYSTALLKDMLNRYLETAVFVTLIRLIGNLGVLRLLLVVVTLTDFTWTLWTLPLNLTESMSGFSSSRITSPR